MFIRKEETRLEELEPLRWRQQFPGLTHQGPQGEGLLEILEPLRRKRLQFLGLRG